MKKTCFAIVATCTIMGANAQTTATDFTAIDCSGNSHNLFTELNAGKVVIITWVMPCGSCIAGGGAANSTTAAFETSNPGQVLYWLVDDLGDITCASLSAWASNNGISKPTLFNNAGNTINENNFGGTGMPHTIVVAPNKQILYNKKNGATNDQTGVTAAVNQALATLSVAEIGSQEMSIAPNPTSGVVQVTCSKGIQSARIVSLGGQTVFQEDFVSGKTNPSIDISKLAAGTYQLILTDIDGKRGVSHIVKQ